VKMSKFTLGSFIECFEVAA